MSARRHYLMSIVNLEKYRDAVFSYVYHSLIPSTLNPSGIPETYQEVEYIESSGTQYIDTGLAINAPTKAEYSFMITGSVSHGHAIAGLYHDSLKDLYFGIVRSADEKLNYRYRDTFYPSITTIVQNTKYNAIVELNVGSQSLSLNGNIETTSNNANSFTNPLSCYLFWINGGSAIPKMIGKLYYFKIYDNGTIVRNFIPCYRKNDSVIGLYDTVNGTFYTNQGTGTFSKGADRIATVQNKAKVAEVYGDSVVWNQLQKMSTKASFTSGDVAITNNNDGSFTLNGTASSTVYPELTLTTQRPDFISGHKYLAISSSSKIKFYYNLTNFGLLAGSRIYNCQSSTSSGLYLYITSGESFSNEKISISLIDLTQEYPFDTPTTLDDPRVQALLNSDYIAYNAGEIKSVDISEISSEPYNLFDGELEGGNIRESTGLNQPNNDCFRTKNYMKVVPNRTYTMEITPPNPASFAIRYYDTNKNYLYGTTLANTNVQQFTTPSECYYIRAYWGRRDSDWEVNIPTGLNICFHRTETRTGYAPHLSPKYWIPSEYQQVEYIESTGTQYINTGLTGQERLNYPIIDESIVEFTQLVNDYQFFGWGQINRCHYGIDSSGRYTLEGGIVSGVPSVGIKRVLKATYLEQEMSLQIDDIATLTRTGGAITTPTLNYTLLGGNKNCYAKLYSTKITIQGTLVRNFVPCYRKSDNVIGMYDTVTKQFFTNSGTGTFLKGADVNYYTIIPFRYQGSGVGTARDTWEITDTEHVFTKKMNTIDLGSLNYSMSYTDVFSSSQMQNVVSKPSAYTIKPYAICPKYETTYADNLAGHNIDKAISVTPAGYIWIRDTSYSSIDDFKTAMSGVPLEFELATPQVIRIPRKHFGIVDLGSLNWNKNTSYTNPFFTTNLLSYIKANGKCYCSLYTTINNTSGYWFGTNASNMSITISSVESVVFIRNDSYTTTQDFKQAMQGQYLFYETEDEVADIPLDLFIQPGGTISQDSSVLPDVLFKLKCK